ncbi:double-strand break repair helicase AddA [Thioclava sp. F28-4]|uniref:double-strand break repair helicase AddA n=1 Tax=Thioclava sp. F28-4 TaxID=1915315 RepID=UPI000997722B|nr:double-strand break repair helicase AddA [Thioclava sp. F28-4]OOY03642.1 double-strand break repair helicase AddA [Thioclava sp. F28-4]
MTHPASLRQHQASQPDSSVWLAANAGSGKTKVLTDRVARMLLAGTEPQRILCLTYTKAAAAEMQNRLLGLLGGWAMMDEAKLREKLRALGADEALSAEDLAKARRLFAKAIETPGGLKIQTIHAFCAGLLRRFPLEAKVSPGFSEMDDRAGELMREDILEEIATGPDCDRLDALLGVYSGEDLTSLAADISRNRVGFAGDLGLPDLLEAYDLPRDMTEEALLSEVFDDDDLKMIREVAPAFLASSKNDQRVGAGLTAARTRDLDAVQALEDVLCVKKPKDGPPYQPKLDKVATKALAKALGDGTMAALSDLSERVSENRPRRLAFVAAKRAHALHRFAQVFLPRLDAYKAARGWLDFDDLIDRAAALLDEPSVAQWVLFRLDGGIDHILVDEAQDTSPRQWRVIERIAEEFTSGEGAHKGERTLFVVGDRKQSIYSFQGADLQQFEEMRAHFARKFADIGRALSPLELEHSFRSSAAVLRSVDLAFARGAEQGLGGAPSHIAFHEALPGRVDLWPAIESVKTEDEDDWESPVDLTSAESAISQLSRMIAAEISAMIAQGVQIPDHEAPGGARPVHEGDFLILVRRRSELFSEIIRACKSIGLAVAGADRLKLGAELAVRDIRSLLSFLATPEDDLSLAEALRSPLLNWSEQELYQLAQPRKGYLWEALRRGEMRPDTQEMLKDLRDNSDFLRPFELIERLLTRHGGRERLLARLGPEAEDGIDELISQALAFERNEVPSLTGFLGWLDADDVQVKRQLDGAGRAIRVMTVHGSKGLEAPIVILPDTAKKKEPNPPKILRLDDGVAGLRQPAPDAPEAQISAAGKETTARTEEAQRLLYVAMTRAEKWLIVAAAGEVGEGDETWYSRMKSGLEAAGTEDVTGLSKPLQELGAFPRHATGAWPVNAVAPAAALEVTRLDLPAWSLTPAAAVEPPPRPLSPSDLGGAKALFGDGETMDEDEALRHGRNLHRLLEHLPERPRDQWEDLAELLLSEGEDALLPGEIEPVLAEAIRVLEAPGMAAWLGPDCLAEVELTAALEEFGGQRIHGFIDRLRIDAEGVHVLDYKSNRIVPASPDQVPEGIVRQMAAYRAALRQIHPGRSITCAILWTQDGTIMPLADAQLDGSLRTPTVS